MGAGRGGDGDDVLVDRSGDLDGVDHADQPVEFVGVGDGTDLVVLVLAAEVLEDRHLGDGVGESECQPHREAVELDVGQREGALDSRAGSGWRSRGTGGGPGGSRRRR